MNLEELAEEARRYAERMNRVDELKREAQQRGQWSPWTPIRVNPDGSDDPTHRLATRTHFQQEAEKRRLDRETQKEAHKSARKRGGGKKQKRVVQTGKRVSIESAMWIQQLTELCFSASPDHIFWRMNRHEYEKNGTQKLCLTHTGGGLSEEGVIQLGKQMAVAMDANPLGVVCSSWQDRDDIGVSVRLWRDHKGVIQHQLIPSEPRPVLQVESEPTPSSKSPTASRVGRILNNRLRKTTLEHGTSITFLGVDEDDNTFFPKGRIVEWVGAYLEAVFFDFPCMVRAEDGKNFKNSGRSGEGGFSRRVFGKKSLLYKGAKSHGTVKLTDAVAYWWVLDPTRKEGHSTKRVNGSLNVKKGWVIHEIAQNSPFSTEVFVVLESPVNRPWDVVLEEFCNNLPVGLAQLSDS